MRPLIGLVAIFKNEAHAVGRTLASVRHIAGTWTILDTGSTDGTQEIVREALGGFQGALHEEPFVDFAHARNRVLELAAAAPEPPVFTLMLSADEVVEGAEALRDFLDAKRDEPFGAYSVEMRAEHSRWFYPRVLRVGAGWTYVNPVHEVPLGPNRETHGPVVPGVCIVHAATDPERRRKRIAEFDLPLLTKLACDESIPIADRAQSVWHLAQTHESLAQGTERSPGGEWICHQMAAMANYWRRVEIGGEDATKTNYALFRYLNIAERVGFYTHEELLNRLDALSEMEPMLAEVRYMIAVHAAQIDARQGLFYAEEAARVAKDVLGGEPTHVPTDTRLEWLSLHVAAGCAKQLGRHEYAKTLAERGVAAGGPADQFEEFMTVPPLVPAGELSTEPSPSASLASA